MPSLTEICFALGLGDSLVGVSDFCNYPPEAKSIPRIGGVVNPDFERVTALRPDFILMQESDKTLLKKYRELGFDILIVKNRTVEDVLVSIVTIGNKTGKDKQARELVEKMGRELNEIRAKAADRKPVRTLLVIGHEPGSLREIYVAGSGSFHNELLRIAGGVNCFSDSVIPYPKISKEEILKQSPQAIIVLSADAGMKTQAKQSEQRLWKELDYIEAVKKNAVTLLNGNYLFIPGPRMPQIAKEIQQLLFSDKGDSDAQ